MTDPVVLENAAAVMEALRLRYPSSAWALFENVPNGTGGRADRWADALALSLWPSRGIDLHGFEIKVSRGDVLRELKDPRKADRVASYCDFWWMVVGSPEIVHADELPSAWGLLVPNLGRKATGLRQEKAAKRLEPKEIDRTFLASILRRASESYNPERLREQIRSEITHAAIDDARRIVDAEHQGEIAALQTRLDAAIAELDAARTRVGLLSHVPVDRVRKAVQILDAVSGWQGMDNTFDRLRRTLNEGRDSLGRVEGILDEIRATAHELLGTEKTT